MALFANPVLKPGMSLMQLLSMSKKIVILSTAFFVPVTLIVYELLTYAHHNIEFAQSERQGVQYLLPLNALQSSATQLQLSGVSAGSVEAGDTALKQLDALVSQGDIFDLRDDIQTLHTHWQAVRGGDALQLVALADALSDVYGDVADHSSLMLDPGLDSSYLMSTVTSSIPRLGKELNAFAVQMHATADADQQLRLAEIAARINLQRQATIAAIGRAVNANKSLTGKLSVSDFNVAGRQLAAALHDHVDATAGAALANNLWSSTAQLNAAATTALDQLLAARISDAQQKINFIGLIAFALFAPALYLLICFYISNESGFGAMVSRMKKLAEGDLSLNFPAQGVDEISELINALNDSRAQLQNLIANIRKSADNIDRAGQQIGSVASKLRQQQVSQADTVKHTAQNVAEISHKVQANLDNAIDANHCAEDAFDVATRGNDVVAQVVDTMQTISTSSNRIGDIIGVIDDIAFQTNLLALNAAVEAARAGTQGAGFAVVAAEVRNLAQRSSAAASEIKKLITHSLENVNRGATLVTTAGDTMKEILQSVKRVSELMNHISTASRTQAEDIGRLNNAVSKIDEDSLRSVALVQDTSSAMSMLDAEVGNLLESVSYFTFDGEAMSDGEHATTQLNAPSQLPTPATQKRVA